MSGSGGRGGSGGAGGAGGSTEKLDAAVKLDTSGGSGGTPDASARLDANSARLDAKLDGGKKETGASAAGTWEKLNLVLANCVFCHNDPDKRVDLQETGLYDRIVNKAAERIPAGCPTKTLIVPNDPMGSLLYLKLTGTMPAGCGERMPYKKPAVTQLELDFVLDWINAGAPPNP